MLEVLLHLVSFVSNKARKIRSKKSQAWNPHLRFSRVMNTISNVLKETSHGCNVAGAAVNIWPQLPINGNWWSNGWEILLFSIFIWVLFGSRTSSIYCSTLGFSFLVLYYVPSLFSGIYIGPTIGFRGDAGFGFFLISVGFVPFILASRCFGLRIMYSLPTEHHHARASFVVKFFTYIKLSETIISTCIYSFFPDWLLALAQTVLLHAPSINCVRIFAFPKLLWK